VHPLDRLGWGVKKDLIYVWSMDRTIRPLNGWPAHGWKVEIIFQGGFTFLKHSCSVEEWYPKHFSAYGVWNWGEGQIGRQLAEMLMMNSE
jgi:hypothetical protein